MQSFSSLLIRPALFCSTIYNYYQCYTQPGDIHQDRFVFDSTKYIAVFIPILSYVKCSFDWMPRIPATEFTSTHVQYTCTGTTAWPGSPLVPCRHHVHPFPIVFSLLFVLTAIYGNDHTCVQRWLGHELIKLIIPIPPLQTQHSPHQMKTSDTVEISSVRCCKKRLPTLILLHLVCFIATSAVL